jgi:hypothetical protein
LAVDAFTALGITSAVAVLIPGVALLGFFRNLKIPTLRNLTLILGLFCIFHGAYHLLFLVDLPQIGNVVDLVTVGLLVSLGIYYNIKVG